MRWWHFMFIFLCWQTADAQQPMRLYLLPGQGSDHRIYQNMRFPDNIDTVHLHYLPVEAEETLEHYAARMVSQIDTTLPFSLMGVSLGGMICVEMSDIIHPQQVFLLSSASSGDEIPDFYHSFRKYPIYHNFNPNLIKYSTFLLQPIYEPDRRTEQKTCNSMIREKDADFMKSAVHMIVTWQRTEADNINTPIIQIHGTADHTLPVENIRADYYIDNGSHMMTLTMADKVSAIISAAITVKQ